MYICVCNHSEFICSLQHSFSKFLEVKKPLFEMTPNKWILEPYQSVVVTLIGHSDM